MRYILIRVSIISIVCVPIVASADICAFATTHAKRIPAEIVTMQRVLNANTETRLAVTGVGSPGMEVPVYGPRMKKALTVFQKKHGIAAFPVGSLTPLTVSTLAAACERLFNPSASIAQLTTSYAANVSLETPSHIPSGALLVPFTKFSITAVGQDIILSSFTIEQKGFSQVGVLEGVVIMDETGEVLGEAKVNSDRRALVRIDEVTITKGETMTFVIGGSTGEVTDFDGQVLELQLVEVGSSQSVSGLPIRGNSAVVVGNYTIGSALAYRGMDDPAIARKRYIQDTNVVFSGIRLNASSIEDIELRGIAFVQSGSAGQFDINNVHIVVNGVSYPAEVDGREYAVSLPAPVRIMKGNWMDVSIKGDIGTTGSGRTVRFDIPASDEIAIFGAQSKFFLEVGVGGNASLGDESTFVTSDGTEDGDSIVPFFYKGSTVTISAGEMTSIGR